MSRQSKIIQTAVWGAKEQRRRRGERKFSVTLTTELTKTTLPAWDHVASVEEGEDKREWG
jgi:hypothetical protein